MTYLNNFSNLELILISIYTFVDDFIKGMVKNIKYALQKPTQNIPPVKKHNLSLAELVSLAIFRFFSGQTNWKKFYHFVKTYHAKDFPNLPSYQNFLDAVNKLSFFAIVLLQALMQFFRKITGLKNIKFADSMKLEICNNIFGMIVADAGYIGKNWQDKALSLGKHLFTAVKANMKKIMTEAEHQILKLRQYVETVFSVLKLRLGMETSLPRSPFGVFAHYIWCLTAYQLDQYFSYIFRPVKLLSA